MASEAFEGVLKVASVTIFGVGALLVSLSIPFLLMPLVYEIHVGNAFITTVAASLATPALILGGLAMLSGAWLWKCRKWGGELGICVSIAIVFLSVFWCPSVSGPGFVPSSVAIVVGSLISAICIAIGWKALK